MAPFTNPLRHLWGRGQAPTTSAPDSIANYDGMSDGEIHDQRMSESSIQQRFNGSSANEKGFVPRAAAQYQAVIHESAYEAAGPRQYEKPSQQPAVHPNRIGQRGTHGLEQATQELGNGGQGQVHDTTRQLPSHTATAQPPETSSQHVLENHHIPAFHSPSMATNASAEVQVKKEPAAEDAGDYNMFAEFTNEDVHNDNGQETTSHQQVIENTPDIAVRASSDAPSIKREPGAGIQLHIDAPERAGTVDSTITVSHNTTEAYGMTHGQTRASSIAEVTSETGACIFKVAPEAGRPQGQDAHSTGNLFNTPTSQLPSTVAPDVTQGQYHFDQCVEDPQQTAVGSRAEASDDKSQQFPLADSVLGSQQHSSEDTATSLSVMDLTTNARLLEQQWKERHKLSGMGTLTAEAVPAMLHSPILVQSIDQNASQPAAGTLIRQHMMNDSFNVLTANQTQSVNGPQRSSDFPYSMNMQYPNYLTGTQHGQVQPYWLAPGYTPNPSMQHAPRPSHLHTQVYQPYGSINSQRITEVQEAEKPEASDDDEPLVTRAPRHRSATSRDSRSPVDATTSPSAPQQRGTSCANAKSIQAAPKPSASGNKEDSVIELIDDDDEEEPAEPISWKLPTYVATYHPPVAATDLPMAKVSIPKLVREEVLLTEDHAEQEMQLFLNVFLPAQQALQTPDREPAHAVINFHTIAVMVLEAFVQYEIGDEMGRGYGFHGGNQALRPSATSSDGEPARTRSATDADVDEIFFAVIDRWRAGLAAGKETLKLVRGCQEFCDVALDVIHYVKEHGLLQPEPKKRKERSDKGVARGPRGGAKEAAAKAKTAAKRKADAVESKGTVKKAVKDKVNELQSRKKAKVEDKKKPKAKAKKGGPGLVVIPRKK